MPAARKNKSLKLLSLETSTQNLSLAVSDDQKILRRRTIKLKGVLSSSIIPAIDKILIQSNVTLNSLSGFAVGLGPGSFTSLRVGLSTVKGLAFAAGKPVIGIPSLDALVLGVKKPPVKNICAICDAKRNLVYACLYQQQNEQMKKKSKYFLINIEDLLSKINQDTFFVGDGVPLFQNEISKAANKSKKWIPYFAQENLWYPRADAIAALAYQRFCENKFDDSSRLVPIYLYPKDCQVRR